MNLRETADVVSQAKTDTLRTLDGNELYGMNIRHGGNVTDDQLAKISRTPLGVDGRDGCRLGGEGDDEDISEDLNNRPMMPKTLVDRWEIIDVGRVKELVARDGKIDVVLGEPSSFEGEMRPTVQPKASRLDFPPAMLFCE